MKKKKNSTNCAKEFECIYTNCFDSHTSEPFVMSIKKFIYIYTWSEYSKIRKKNISLYTLGKV